MLLLAESVTILLYGYQGGVASYVSVGKCILYQIK
jgi:hypothetical protein